jgi:hypothetical protein
MVKHKSRHFPFISFLLPNLKKCFSKVQVSPNSIRTNKLQKMKLTIIISCNTYHKIRAF